MMGGLHGDPQISPRIIDDICQFCANTMKVMIISFSTASSHLQHLKRGSLNPVSTILQIPNVRSRDPKELQVLHLLRIMPDSEFFRRSSIRIQHTISGAFPERSVAPKSDRGRCRVGHNRTEDEPGSGITGYGAGIACCHSPILELG
jgi:hypothetical protein